MARKIADFGPEDLKPNSATFGDPGIDSQYRRYLALALSESFDTPQFHAPQGLTTPITAIVTYRMASATANNVAMDLSLEAISDGDAVDTDAASSFDTANASGDVAVPATAGYIDQMSVTLTNNDSIAAGDLVRMRGTRTTPASSAAGDMQILAIELRDSA